MGTTPRGVRPALQKTVGTPQAQPTTAQATPQAATSPLVTYQYGSVSAAVFANDVKTADGRTFTAHNVSLRRSYRTAAGWEHSHSLRQQDLLPAAFALERCYEFLGLEPDADDENQQAE